jgi:phosphatidylserine/phosphatidylglycerophosphate/cardiolipin synthase-like enzyme
MGFLVGLGCSMSNVSAPERWDLADIALEFIDEVCAAQERILIAAYSMTNSDIIKAIIEVKDCHPELRVSLIIDEKSVASSAEKLKFLAKCGLDVYLFGAAQAQQDAKIQEAKWLPLMYHNYAVVIDDILWHCPTLSGPTQFTKDDKTVETVVDDFEKLVPTLPNYRLLLEMGAAQEFIEKINNAHHRFFLCISAITNTDVISALREAKNRGLDVRLFIHSLENRIFLKAKGIMDIYAFSSPDLAKGVALIDDAAWHGTSDFVQKNAKPEISVKFIKSCEGLFRFLSERHRGAITT